MEERPGKLCGIRRDSGESFRLSYDKDGYLKSVADHTGRTFTYEVEGGRLIRAVRPDGGAFVYEYNGNGKLSGVTNPRGITTVENELMNSTGQPCRGSRTGQRCVIIMMSAAPLP